MNSPESEKNPPKLNKATIDILIGVVIFTVIVALLMHRYLPKDERTGKNYFLFCNKRKEDNTC